MWDISSSFSWIIESSWSTIVLYNTIFSLPYSGQKKIGTDWSLNFARIFFIFFRLPSFKSNILAIWVFFITCFFRSLLNAYVFHLPLSDWVFMQIASQVLFFSPLFFLFWTFSLRLVSSSSTLIIIYQSICSRLILVKFIIDFRLLLRKTVCAWVRCVLVSLYIY